MYYVCIGVFIYFVVSYSIITFGKTTQSIFLLAEMTDNYQNAKGKKVQLYPWEQNNILFFKEKNLFEGSP